MRLRVFRRDVTLCRSIDQISPNLVKEETWGFKLHHSKRNLEKWFFLYHEMWCLLFCISNFLLFVFEICCYLYLKCTIKYFESSTNCLKVNLKSHLLISLSLPTISENTWKVKVGNAFVVNWNHQKYPKRLQMIVECWCPVLFSSQMILFWLW